MLREWLLVMVLTVFWRKPPFGRKKWKNDRNEPETANFSNLSKNWNKTIPIFQFFFFFVFRFSFIQTLQRCTLATRLPIVPECDSEREAVPVPPAPESPPVDLPFF
jgi:steroid 5-alpha reductase family enzyme